MPTTIQETSSAARPEKTSLPYHFDSSEPVQILERIAVIGIICAALILTSLPYLIGALRCPRGLQFLGQMSQVDDYCVYLSWIRQVTDGHFFAKNLFTTDAQHGVQFNVFFLLLGGIVRATGMSPFAAIQTARILGATALLLVIFRFYRTCLPRNRSARITAFAFTTFGSGFGWFFAGICGLPIKSVDIWQPETFTFFTIYNTALSTISALLIATALYQLFQCEQTGKTSHAVFAGIAMLILGNVHTYDIGQTTATWGCFLIIKTVQERSINRRLWIHSATAWLIALPSVIYQLYVYAIDPVFHQRAGVGMWTPPPIEYIIGYGLPLFFAAETVLFLRRKTREVWESFSGHSAVVMMVSWMIATLAIIYLIPVPFQRRMVLGEHIPLCLLAGLGAAYMIRKVRPRSLRIAGLALLIVLASITNIAMVRRDIAHLHLNRTDIDSAFARPYLNVTQIDALRWARIHTAPDDGLIAPPDLAVYLPGYADRAVWMGHWSETPNCDKKLLDFCHFVAPGTSEGDREAFLRGTHARYLFYPNDPGKLEALLSRIEGQNIHAIDLHTNRRQFLTPLYQNGGYTVYAIAPANRNHPQPL